MTCQKCGSTWFKCINSRPYDKKNAIIRRRECEYCGHRWTTLEINKEYAVDIVLCRECKNYQEYCVQETQKPAGIGRCKRGLSSDLPSDFYCSYGVRR